jgi:hypothetical protein
MVQATFATMVPGSEGEMTFRVAAIDVPNMSLTLELVALGVVLGTATIDLANNVGTLEFSQPLATAGVNIVRQVFAHGDLIIGPDRTIVMSHGSDPSSGNVFLSDDFNVQAPGMFYRKVGHIDAASVLTSET